MQMSTRMNKEEGRQQYAPMVELDTTMPIWKEQTRPTRGATSDTAVAANITAW
jgi:hypothetical protein